MTTDPYALIVDGSECCRYTTLRAAEAAAAWVRQFSAETEITVVRCGLGTR